MARAHMQVYPSRLFSWHQLTCVLTGCMLRGTRSTACQAVAGDDSLTGCATGGGAKTDYSSTTHGMIR